MKYVGSKNRIAKYLLPLILGGRKPGELYVEPFVGGCNIIDKVPGDRWGNDMNPYLIAMLRSIQKGWEPPQSVSEEEYADIKANKDVHPPELVGYVGFQLSYGAKWFGGYRRDKVGKRDYPGEAYRNVVKQSPLLSGIRFTCGSYTDMEIPAGATVYCDPPYANATSYSHGLNHHAFWAWAHDLSYRGCNVFVSEYAAPDEWEAIWERRVNSSLDLDRGSKQAVESLFTLRA